MLVACVNAVTWVGKKRGRGFGRTSLLPGGEQSRLIKGKSITGGPLVSPSPQSLEQRTISWQKKKTNERLKKEKMGGEQVVRGKRYKLNQNWFWAQRKKRLSPKTNWEQGRREAGKHARSNSTKVTGCEKKSNVDGIKKRKSPVKDGEKRDRIKRMTGCQERGIAAASKEEFRVNASGYEGTTRRCTWEKVGSNGGKKGI